MSRAAGARTVALRKERRRQAKLLGGVGASCAVRGGHHVVKFPAQLGGANHLRAKGCLAHCGRLQSARPARIEAAAVGPHLALVQRSGEAAPPVLEAEHRQSRVSLGRRLGALQLRRVRHRTHGGPFPPVPRRWIDFAGKGGPPGRSAGAGCAWFVGLGRRGGPVIAATGGWGLAPGAAEALCRWRARRLARGWLDVGHVESCEGHKEERGDSRRSAL